MKWKKILAPTLFLLISVGLVLTLGVKAAANSPTEEELEVKEAALEYLVPYYTDLHLTDAWRTAARGQQPEAYKVSYELWQSRAQLGRRFTYVKEESTGRWDRWARDQGGWTYEGSAEPSPSSKPVRLGRFTVEIPPLSIHKQQVDEVVALEMGHAMEKFIREEDSILAEHTLLTLVNTKELYGLVSRETGEDFLKNRYLYAGIVTRVDVARDEDGRLRVTSWKNYNDEPADRRAFYQAITACDGAVMLIAPEEHLAKRAIKDFLQGEGSLKEAESGKFYKLNQLNAMLDTQTVEVAGFALADLDGYGVTEAVLKLTVDGVARSMALVLRWEAGQLVAYRQNRQGLYTVKEDGTFSFFRGEAVSGYGRLEFRDGQADLLKLTWEAHGTDSEGEPMFAYYVGSPRRPQNYAQYQADLEWQAEKPEAIWYDLTPEGLEAGLSAALQLENSTFAVE